MKAQNINIVEPKKLTIDVLGTSYVIDGSESYLDGIDTFQSQAIEDTNERLAIIAPAGSGKTTVVINRVNMLAKQYAPTRIWCAGFTNKAANEMRVKLSKLDLTQVHSLTLHKLALEIITDNFDKLHQKWNFWRNDGSAGAIDEKARNKILRSVTQNGKIQYPDDGITFKQTKHDIDAWQTSGIKPTSKARRYVIKAFQNELKRIGFIDINSVIPFATNLLKKPNVTLPVIDALLIDEAQDLNKSQIAFVEALKATTLTAVGDPLQAIYTFQGADSTWLTGFTNIDKLHYCYRSTKSIVECAAALTDTDFEASPKAEQGVPVTGYAADTELEEAGYICDQIEEYLSDSENRVNAWQIAILTRQTTQQRAIKAELAKRGICGVLLKTVHKFKGGESEVVFVPGLNEQQWNPDSNEQDLLSTLYVALTRAKIALHLSWSGESRINGQIKPVHRLHLLDKLPIEWTKKVTTREEIEQSLKKFPTLSEKTRADLAERKHATERIADAWEYAGNPKTANKIRNCTSLAVYGHYQSESTGKDRWLLEHSDFCMIRSCLICNWRRSVRNRMKLEALVNYIFAENTKSHPKLTDPARLNNPLFITFTIPNVKAESLKEAVKLLLSGWRNLTRNSKRSPLWTQGLTGFWRSIEITRNEETGLYHPHLHVLMLATNAYYSDPNQKRNHSKLYMTSQQWAQKWTRAVMLALGQKATKSTQVDKYISEIEPEDTSVLDYYGETKSTDVDKPREQFKGYEIEIPSTTNHFIVDVRSVYNAENRHNAISEVTKYVTKDETMLSKKIPKDELVSRLKTLDNAIYRVRLVEDGGIINTTEESIDVETLIAALLDGTETWTKLGESSFTYMNDKDYHETAEQLEAAPSDEDSELEDDIDFLD